MIKVSDICKGNLKAYTEFKELPVEQQKEERFPYNRYLEIADKVQRYLAFMGPTADDRHFVRDTYKYSVSTGPRPQDKKKKQEESPPDETGEDKTELHKSSRLEWIRFLKGCFSISTIPPPNLSPLSSPSNSIHL